MTSTGRPRSRHKSPDEHTGSLADDNRTGSTIFKMFDHLGLSVIHPAGSVLFEEGDQTSGVYLVRAGQIKLICSDGRNRSMILRIARSGEILGLSAMLNGCGHEMTAKTLTECNLTHIAPIAFMDFLKGFAEAGALALVALARDHRELLLSARRLALYPLASSRIAQVLIAFSHSDASEKTSSSFTMLLTHTELASLIGTSRETVTRVLNNLERKKIIARNQAFFTILKHAKLSQFAN